MLSELAIRLHPVLNLPHSEEPNETPEEVLVPLADAMRNVLKSANRTQAMISGILSHIEL